MIGYGPRVGWVVVACSSLVACTLKNPLDGVSVAGGGATGTVSSAGSSGRSGESAGGLPNNAEGHEGDAAGEAGDAGSGRGLGEGGAPNGVGIDGTSAGEAGAAGAVAASPDPPPAECALDGGTCSANPHPTCAEPRAKCTVRDPGFSCELPKFAGVSATVACGATATVGTACCGACGCVKVEVYYDGEYCWEGFPDCSLPEYAGKLLFPKLPDQ